MDHVCEREEHLRQQSEPIRLRCERIVTVNALEAHLRLPERFSQNEKMEDTLLLRPGADSD